MTDKKQERVEQAFDTLRQGVLELIQDPEQMQTLFKEYGDHYEYNTYSPFNTMILIFETAIRKGKQFQMARGYRQWEKKFNRKVKKGEKAMYILAPNKIKVTEKDEETGEETVSYIMKGFRPVPVFELSQTEGEPIERPTKNHEYKSLNQLRAKDFIDACGVKVEFEDLLRANGYTNGKKIVLGNHNSELANICTLFHELAHFHLHYDREGEEIKLYSDDSTNLKELEAETVSFMVSSALGIENTYSKKYIANWNGDTENLEGEFRERSYKLLMEALNQIDTFIELTNS